MSSLLHRWFAAKGWTPWSFQEEAWEASVRGQSGLIHVATGAGKTYAAALGPLTTLRPGGGVQLLWITPLRAVVHDVERALDHAVSELGLGLKVGARTGDTSTAVRKKQSIQPPDVLITTPESLTLGLTDATAPERFRSLRTVVVDEWHELLGSKRGTQTELALARLRSFAPNLSTWALSATLDDVPAAAAAAVGPGRPYTLIEAEVSREIEMVTLLPPSASLLRWAGHTGLRMLPALLEWLRQEWADRRSRGLGPGSGLLFTNTRSQAERWFQAVSGALPELAAELALHHGSLDQDERARVERGLKAGELRLVVCTSTLDLGVDFGPVEHVICVGSPKGVSRVLQRAGRAAHRPGGKARVLGVPTHALEVLEFAAMQEAIRERRIEPRAPLDAPLDVLAQHLVTVAMGGGLDPDALFREVAGTAAYARLDRALFDDVLRLVRDGGRTLVAYPDYHRIVLEGERYQVRTPKIAAAHRAAIGTIVGDASLTVQLAGHGRLGSIEESFIGRLSPGTAFAFAGRRLELVGVQDDVVKVRLARGRASRTAVWGGSRFPISVSLSTFLRRQLGSAARGTLEGPEMLASAHLFDTQRRISHLPDEHELLLEVCSTDEGFHHFLYPFEGRLVHEGLAALLAVRLSRRQPGTFQLAVNDYGIELLTPEPLEPARFGEGGLFSDHDLDADIAETSNLSALDRRQFREVARVAGLLPTGHPGSPRAGRQLRSNAALLFDVFSRYDPDHMLLAQARREVLNRHFEVGRLRDTLRRLASQKLVIRSVSELTPLGLPILVERMLSAQTLSTESVEARIARLTAGWEQV